MATHVDALVIVGDRRGSLHTYKTKLLPVPHRASLPGASLEVIPCIDHPPVSEFIVWLCCVDVANADLLFYLLIVLISSLFHVWDPRCERSHLYYLPQWQCVHSW